MAGLEPATTRFQGEVTVICATGPSCELTRLRLYRRWLFPAQTQARVREGARCCQLCWRRVHRGIKREQIPQGIES